jgi:hypothetical protein
MGIHQMMFGGGFSPRTVTYNSGSGTETAPSGATNVVITLWGPGGSGGDGDPSPGQGGGGGGGGGYSTRSAACAGGNSLSYAVGVVGTSNTTVSGTLTGGGSISMSANRGTAGSSPGLGGAGGTASGGTTNTTGTAGDDGSSDPSIGGNGGASPNGGGADLDQFLLA